MNKQLTEEILRMYISHDPIRPGMKQFIPVTWKGEKWCGATDGHRAILIPETAENKFPECSERAPDIASVMIPETQKVEVSMDGLQKAIIEVERIVQSTETEIECPDCDGRGKFDHGSHEYECKECDCSGIIEKEAEFLIDFGDRKIKYQLIRDLFFTVKKSGSKKVWAVGVKKQLVLLKTDTGIYVLISGFNLDLDIEPVKSDIRFSKIKQKV